MPENDYRLSNWRAGDPLWWRSRLPNSQAHAYRLVNLTSFCALALAGLFLWAGRVPDEDPEAVLVAYRRLPGVCVYERLTGRPVF